jgi:hypothetical protein
MLLIKTIVKESTIPGAGLGLFADEDLPLGTVTWKFQDGLDQIISPETLAAMSADERAICLKHAYLDTVTNNLIMCGDDERFINHSDTPNVAQVLTPTDPEGIEITSRDIKKGEELFCNYYDFDAYAADKLKDVQ